MTTIGLALILPIFGSGPLWPLSVDNTAQVCRKSWLYNIFFINNFQKPDDMCLLHTWYLSANMQFHVLGGFILYIIYRYIIIVLVGQGHGKSHNNRTDEEDVAKFCHILIMIMIFIKNRSPRAGVIMCFILTAVSSAASFAFSYINSMRVPSVIAYEVFAHE